MSICINPSCPNPENRDTVLFCQSCSSELLLEGRYRVTDKLGSGGFGKTYEVSDGTLPRMGDRHSVSKVLKVLTSNHPKYVELFQREAQVLSQLSHPGIPKMEPDAYFTFWPKNNQQPVHCLVMEKIEGLNLQQYIQQRGNPIDQKCALKWIAQLAAILQEVHSHNFFHRDIKPSNIMLTAGGQLVLIDFGAAREITETFVAKQALGQVTGVISAGYTPPEQLNGQAVPQSDFFALGRTCVYLITAQDPSKFYNAYSDELLWRHAVPNLLPQFADFLDRLMARSPNQRPQTAQEILQQLEEIKRAVSQLLVKPSPQSLANFLGEESTPSMPLSTSSTNQSNNTNTTKQWIPPTSPPTPSPTSTHSRIEPGFINRCKKELAEFIGPIATIVCQRTLTQNPELSMTEFVEALAKQIPNQKQALEFQRRLLS
jgi:eukaryotic-like serine/threonine-protein kinase